MKQQRQPVKTAKGPARNLNLIEHTWTVTLEGYFPPNPNRTIGRHWAGHKKQKKLAAGYLFVYGHKAGGLPTFVGPVQVRITRRYGAGLRAFDIDNLVAACKVLIDVLKPPSKRNSHGMGVIEEDNPDILTLAVDQERSAQTFAGATDTVITISGRIEAPAQPDRTYDTSDV